MTLRAVRVSSHPTLIRFFPIGNHTTGVGRCGFGDQVKLPCLESTTYGLSATEGF